jgi:hypothetical protein
MVNMGSQELKGYIVYLAYKISLRIFKYNLKNKGYDKIKFIRGSKSNPYS